MDLNSLFSVVYHGRVFCTMQQWKRAMSIPSVVKKKYYDIIISVLVRNRWRTLAEHQTNSGKIIPPHPNRCGVCDYTISCLGGGFGRWACCKNKKPYGFHAVVEVLRSQSTAVTVRSPTLNPLRVGSLRLMHTPRSVPTSVVGHVLFVVYSSIARDNCIGRRGG